MKTNDLRPFLLGIAGAMIFLSCGKSKTINLSSEAISNALPPRLATTTFETHSLDATMLPKDYYQTADLCLQNMQIKQQRDLLEQCYRLHADDESFARLQQITVNALEEESAVLDQILILLDTLTTKTKRQDAFTLLASETFFDLLMPKLKSGYRNYYYQTPSSGDFLFLKVGYSDLGQPTCSVWFTSADHVQSQLHLTPAYAQDIDAVYVDGAYSGPFSSQTYIRELSDILYEEGIAQENRLIGEYIAKLHIGSQESDLLSLIASTSEEEYTSYFGSFRTDGTTLEEQSVGQKRTSLRGDASDEQILYAYTTDHKSYLSIARPQDSDALNYQFGVFDLGFQLQPAVTLYQPQDPLSQDNMTSKVNIRIYDSMIQIFEQGQWKTIGDVAEYLVNDPFYAYTIASPSVPENDSSSVYDRRSVGKLTPQATANPKPGKTQTSSQNQTPSAPASSSTTPSTQTPPSEAPTNAPQTPAPSTPAPSQPQPMPSQPSAPSTEEPSTPSSSAPSEGQDTDLEWLPFDVM
ncbi:MAG: hypothetical protein LBM60_04810 [Clostridium sp.]|jgi:hypothetical protein|nr:hypothetical protein [Clostridium sp.]